jgi:hypothetical protein
MFTTLWPFACGEAAVPVASAPTTRASSMTLTDGVIDVAGLAEHYVSPARPITLKGTTPRVEQTFYVAPVRGPGAETGPVHAWVTCHSRIKTAAECRDLFSTVTSVSGRVLWRYDLNHDTGWLKAIDASGLSSVAQAPVILVE